MTDRIREFYLDEISAWRSGAKATPGSPSTGENYALRMREEIKYLERRLEEYMVTKYDTVYFWMGGTEYGEWYENKTTDLDASIARIRKMGHYAIKGCTSIGAPEGPPAGLADFMRELRHESAR